VSSGLDIVNIAQKQLGFIEGPNNENPYGIWYGMPNVSYCAIFVSWVFKEANLSALVAAETPKGFSYCPSGLTWFQKHGQIVPKGTGRPGDIVFYDFSGKGVAEHVGILENCSTAGLTVIEGNTSPDHATGSQANGIGVFRRHRPWLNVIAVARPNYPMPVAPTTPTKHKVMAGGVAGATALGGGGAAMLNNNTSTTPVKSQTVLVAPPFPGTSAFKAGYKSQAAMIVEKALANAGLLPISLVTGVLTAEDLALVPVYQSKYPGLKKEKGIGPFTYTSMVAKAGQ
jgi:CHAP domain